jgi:hypothetical protein
MFILKEIFAKSIIPKDVILAEILPYFTLMDSIKSSTLNKYFNNKCNIYKKNTKKIQKSFRRHRIPVDGFYSTPHMMSYNLYIKFLAIHRVKLYYRYYLIHYPEEYLFELPENIINTRNRYNPDSVEIQEARNWIQENIPTKEHRTRRDILKFFKEMNVSVYDFVNTGW